MSTRPSATAGSGVFVTGTDTGAGKTLVASALLRAFAGSGLRAAGMKPVASGCNAAAQDRANEDVAALNAASNVRAPLDLVNPYCFEPAIAPHIAARTTGVIISLEHIRENYVALTKLADRVVVEGAGGLLVPLHDTEDFADLARVLGIPVLLVVGLRLGCLNHALLTAEAIVSRGLPFAGWVANQIDPAMPYRQENIDTLRQRLPAPLLAIIPFGVHADDAVAAMRPVLAALQTDD